jgi:hypothetical protein
VVFRPSEEDLLSEIDERLRLATAPTSELFRLLISTGCPRVAACNPAILNRLHRLLETGAYTDAALCLIEAELPSWKLHRLVLDGDWHCSLSRTPWVPAELDDLAQADHESLALAILRTFVAARRMVPLTKARVTAVPQIASTRSLVVCCDNFT